MKKLFVVLMYFMSIFSLSSQIKINMKIVGFNWWNIDCDGFSVPFAGTICGNADPSFNIYYKTADTLLIPRICYRHYDQGGGGSGSTSLSIYDSMFTNNINQYKMVIQFFEDDGCGNDDCEGNTGCGNNDDNIKNLTFNDFKFDSIPPQKYFTNFAEANDNYKLTLSYKYSYPNMLPPTIVNSTGLSQILCPENIVTFKTNFDAPKNGTRYKWEYILATPSNPPSINTKWLSFGYTNDSFITMKLIDSFAALDTLQLQSNLYTRVICINVDGQDTSGWSVHSVFPRAPRTSTILSFGTCVGQSNGKIELKNISTVNSQMRYILKNGPNKYLPCDPTNLNSCFTSSVKDGFFNYPPDFVIENIAKDDYALWLINGGGLQGSCYNIYDVSIKDLPVLTFTIDSVKNVSCPNGNDAVIYAKRNNTSPPYILQGVPNFASVLYQDTIIKIGNLKMGSFNIDLKDRCLDPKNIQATITQPTAISVSISRQNPECRVPGDGWIRADVSGGSGAFNYYLFKDNQPIDSVLNANTTFNLFSNLGFGSYKIKVMDATRTFCTPFLDTVNLPINLNLSIQKDSVKDALCNGAANGKIYVSAKGGYPKYRYKIFDLAQNIFKNSDTAFFDSLASGYYKVVVYNRGLFCMDSAFVDSVFVGQPNPLSVSLTKANVSCKGADNGYIAAHILGGTLPYSYYWEFKNGTVWTPYSSNFSMDSIYNLFPSEYRVRIVDDHNCTIYSDSVDVKEPNTLSISSASASNIKCFGETGTIEVNPVGGNPPYTTYLSTDNGISYTPFVSNTTPIFAGEYQLKLTDSKGCEVVFPQKQLLTNPPSQLDFDFQKSNYNGYNVSCLGSTNGFIDLDPMGGNGDTYTGYFFSIDSVHFVDSLRFSNLLVGTYPIYLKDGRNCIIKKDITLSQPDSIKIYIDSTIDVRCGLDSNGKIFVRGSGGTAPYQYQLGTNPYSTSSAFLQLPIGLYILSIKDVNGCIHTISGMVNSQFPPISVHADIQRVSCFGGNDGKIDLTVKGGVAPYKYLWLPTLDSTQNIDELDSGYYQVQIEDNVGCKYQHTYFVTQPLRPLSASKFVVPICEGKTTGAVYITPSGGTKPYRYSMDSILFKNDSFFEGLPISYNAYWVQDSSGCSFLDSFIIVPQKIDLTQNFLVHTKGFEKDTLFLVDITTPKADTNKWVFDLRAQVLDSLGERTAIVFNSPDTTYTITLKSYFATCEYTLTKTITVLTIDSNKYAVKDTSGIIAFNISPNPNNGNFNFDFQLGKIYPNISLLIYNSLGQEVYRKTMQNLKDHSDSVAAPNLSDGNYFVKLVVDNDLKTKVIIVRQ